MTAGICDVNVTMVSGDNATVTLTGGAPWGFRLTGGGSLPLQIAKIRKKSQAHVQGLKEGDAVVSINGLPVHDRSHDEAVDLIDNAGDTLTLQIYRGDANDLGQLLASDKPHAPLFPPHDEGEAALAARGTTSSSASSHVVQDDGSTRREVQQKVFVSSEGDNQGTTFVRREQTVTSTTTSGITLGSDVNGNDAGGSDVGGGFTITASVDVDELTNPAPEPSFSFRLASPQTSLSISTVSPLTVDVGQSSMATSLSLSPGANLSPRFSPAAPPRQTSSPQPPPISPKPSLFTQPQPQTKASSAPRGPTFKAVRPKVGPEVPPKPVVVGGQVVTSDPLLSPKPQFQIRPTFNAKAAAQVSSPISTYSPGKFQVQATAMYSQQLSSPRGASTSQAYSSGKGSQPFSPVPSQQQQPGFPSPPQQFRPQQPVYGKQVNRQVSYTSTSSKQFVSPMSVSSNPYSPDSIYSPTSQGAVSPTPIFHVRNNLGEGNNMWQPNMWLGDPEPGKSQPRQHKQQQRHQDVNNNRNNNNENVEVPRHMSIKERQQMLLTQTARTHHSLSARQADPDFDAPPEEVQREMSHRLHVFGPPVEIAGPNGHPAALEHMDNYDMDSEASSPTSSLLRHRKMYSDSAFYKDATHKYPTIDEQMKLCRLISHSLTSAANRRARGAKMFIKRRKRSAKWVHEGHEWGSSSAGDVANLEELDSELDLNDGGSRQLFAFRIPNIKHRVAPPETNTHMALKKDEFERLRLQAQKCDHRAVPPSTCFDIVADLKASKGRGGRLFERRKNRADKFIIDESNARVAVPKPPRLEDLLGQGGHLKSTKSPWEAARENERGAVDAAFDHLGERERMAKLNQIIKYTSPKPAPLAPPPVSGPRSNLRDEHGPNVLEGRNFNRSAKGWTTSSSERHKHAPLLTQVQHIDLHAPPDNHRYHQNQQHPPRRSQPPQPPRVQYGDYNPRPRAWQPAPGEETQSCPPSMSASWNSGDFDAVGHNGVAGSGFYSRDELPAFDL